MNEFKKVMAEKSDSQLLEILTKLRNDYQPVAIEAAEEEVRNRNISTEQINLAEIEIKERETKNFEKENEPLGMGQKILFLLFFWGVIPWAIAGTFKNSGYLQKYKDAWKFMKVGFGIFVGIPIILILILKIIG